MQHLNVFEYMFKYVCLIENCLLYNFRSAIRVHWLFISDKCLFKNLILL